MSATVRPVVLDVARSVTALDDAYMDSVRAQTIEGFVPPKLTGQVEVAAAAIAFVIVRAGIALHKVTARDVRSIMAASGASGVVAHRYAPAVARRIRAARYTS